MPINDCDQIYESFRCPQVADVNSPDLIRPIDGQISQQIGIGSGLFVSLAQIGTRIENANAHFVHIPADPSFADFGETQDVQFFLDSSNSIGRFFVMNPINGILYGNLLSCNLNLDILVIRGRACEVQ